MTFYICSYMPTSNFYKSIQRGNDTIYGHGWRMPFFPCSYTSTSAFHKRPGGWPEAGEARRGQMPFIAL